MFLLLHKELPPLVWLPPFAPPLCRKNLSHSYIMKSPSPKSWLPSLLAPPTASCINNPTQTLKPFSSSHYLPPLLPLPSGTYPLITSAALQLYACFRIAHAARHGSGKGKKCKREHTNYRDSKKQKWLWV